MNAVRTRHKVRRGRARPVHPTAREAAEVRAAFEAIDHGEGIEVTLDEITAWGRTGRWPTRLR
jgi:hypothetical protein